MTRRMSVLDTSPIVEGSTAADALARSLDLARACEGFGYHRYWVAEHHGMRGVASAVPSVTVAAIASHTRAIRVGAGGVMLPNHPPLHVAEQYGMLDGLFPGRVDLALGRARGGTVITVDALRPAPERAARPFTDQIDELESYFRPGSPDGPRAVPAEQQRPAVWVLGSSVSSAQVAAARGLPYAFAHHLAPDGALDALERYREDFVPSEHEDQPRCLLCVAVIAGDTVGHAEWLAGSTRLKVLSRSHGRPIRLPSPESAAGYEYTDDDRAVIERAARAVLTGDESHLRERLAALAGEAGVDELMVTSPIFGHHDRVRSYELTRSAAHGLP